MRAITIWSEADYDLVRRLAETTSYRAIGQRYGISGSAAKNRLRRYRLRCGDHPHTPRQLSLCDVARVLGCSYHTVRKWHRSGALLFPLTGVAGRPACIIRDVLDFLEAGHALCLSIQPPASELFWCQTVKRIRRDLQRRWANQRLLRDALGISKSTVNVWYKRGFPRPMIHLGHYGVWLDRHAVAAWLNEHGGWTKAARLLVEE